MYVNGQISKAAKVSEELNYQKARFALEQAQSMRNVLVEYTKSKTITELRDAVDKAGVVELEKKAIWNSEKSKEIELEREVRERTN
jgi:hypothetical protein